MLHGNVENKSQDTVTMTDPYEQQLRAVFESCDVRGVGKLDSDGLMKLCDQLHLEDGRCQLMECLLPAFTFEQFRDALLALLAASRRQSDREPSPEREVSPKFVFGQKKYGRRSRPESTDQEDDDDENYDNDVENEDPFLPLCEDNISTKKKPSSLLIDDFDLNERDSVITPTSVQAVILDKEEIESPRGQGEAELRKAWRKLGVGTDGYLDPTELALVCRAVGMEKMADEVVKQVFAKLDVDAEGRISFEEFLELFRSTHTQTQSADSDSPRNIQPSSFQHQHLSSLDVTSSGYVSSESLVDLWEAGGVVNAASLLLDLGVSNPEVNLTSLSAVLEEEVRSMATKTASVSPQVNALTAALVLAQTQLKWTRSCLEQMTGERDKLHSDLAEANQRAALIATEVDDRHARMERASQTQIKLLEQKHAEQVKQLSAQLAVDRDQLTATTLRLEQKLALQQEEEARLRAELNTLQQDFEVMERENQALSEQLADYVVYKNKSERDGLQIQQLQQRVQDLEGNSEQVQSLVEQLAKLQTENTNLRDRNDELTIQVENLTARPICKRQNSSGSVEGSSGGTKRRGHSPLACPVPDSWEQDSPRLGKVRRYCTDTDLSLDSVQLEGLAIGRTMRHSESGLEADFDTLDNSLTLSSPSIDKVTFNIGGCDDAYLIEIENLRATVAELQKTNDEMKTKLATQSQLDSMSTTETSAMQLASEGVAVKEEKSAVDDSCGSSSLFATTLKTESTEVQTSFDDTTDVNQLERHCHELRHTLDEVQQEVLKILSEKRACNEENCALKQRIQQLSRRLPKTLTEDVASLDENVSGPLTYTISNNLDTVVPSASENINSPNNVALKCFPFFEKQGSLNSSYCLFPAKDVKDNGSFKFENLSQFAFELSQSLSDANLAVSPLAVSEVKPLSPCLSEEKCSVIGKLAYENSNEESDMDKSKDNDKTEILRLTKENTELKEKCTELENALELMREEYEKCEDYWQGKLNEERTIFYQEQKVSDEKFVELETKIQEYAELFGMDERRLSGRLPTIDEKDNLEKQVTDLEEEFEEYKKVAQKETQQKTEVIERLQSQLEEMHQLHYQKDVQDTGIQVALSSCEFRLHEPKSNSNTKLSVPSIEVTGPGGVECCCPCHTGAMSRKHMSRLRECRTRLQTECEMLHRRREILLHQMTQLQRTNLIYTPSMGDRRLASDVEMFHNLSSRLRHQELRCRHLQSALKHHQRETDKLLQNAWDQHRLDLSSIQKTLHTTQEKLIHQTKLCKQQMERLSAADVLVKDLYKENAHLTAQVLKLEEQNMFVDQSILGSTV
ncbi:blastoderm-specific protein 25D [Macrosteles quadrilineatus]|uniref:blastoderm-specific protein 25D n=1 Tax=Macrosteles quadrilineatus TaxID=74068 RepID=UPI0023E12465|nr:blastoderm-specific protein 25D [Macrosteles quadrilineatus]